MAAISPASCNCGFRLPTLQFEQILTLNVGLLVAAIVGITASASSDGEASLT